MADKIPGRIPFEEIGESHSWVLPDVSGVPINSEEQRKRKVKAGQKKTEQKKRANTVEDNIISEPVDVEVSATPSSITAQQLEEITQAAEQDGFEKGYSEGLDQGKVDGRKSGYSEGLKAGKEQAYSEQSQLLKACSEKLAEVATRLLRPLEQQEKDLANATLNLALGLAQSILDQELEIAPHKLIGLVQQAIESLPPGEEKIHLYLNPEDLAAYQEFAPAHAKLVTLHPDINLDRGGCRVESEHSYVDYSIASRLHAFREGLKDKPYDQAAAEKPIPDTIAAASAEFNKDEFDKDDIDESSTHQNQIQASGSENNQSLSENNQSLSENVGTASAEKDRPTSPDNLDNTFVLCDPLEQESNKLLTDSSHIRPSQPSFARIRTPIKSSIDSPQTPEGSDDDT